MYKIKCPECGLLLATVKKIPKGYCNYSCCNCNTDFSIQEADISSSMTITEKACKELRETGIFNKINDLESIVISNMCPHQFKCIEDYDLVSCYANTGDCVKCWGQEYVESSNESN